MKFNHVALAAALAVVSVAGAAKADAFYASADLARATCGADPVVWVELIPLEETRRYVQRVLTNYVIYRSRLGEAVSIEQALRRIPG